MSAVLLVIWSLPSAADLQATNSRVSELELRQTNNLAYLENRHNNLEAKVIDLSNSTDRRLDRLEARTGR
jgi:porphobilinogen deaminase